MRKTACFVSLSFAGLVVLARSLNPIPSRTRPLNSSAPMVLWLKPWESRSLPGLPRTKQFLFTCHDRTYAVFHRAGGVLLFVLEGGFDFLNVVKFINAIALRDYLKLIAKFL